MRTSLRRKFSLFVCGQLLMFVSIFCGSEVFGRIGTSSVQVVIIIVSFGLKRVCVHHTTSFHVNDILT
jgi:hypothetical protein